jgi:hypothetical protein
MADNIYLFSKGSFVETWLFRLRYVSLRVIMTLLLNIFCTHEP